MGRTAGEPQKDTYSKLYVSKPLFSKGGDLFPITFLLTSLLIIVALPAEAGLFSSILNFFSDNDGIREVSASAYDLESPSNPPLLGRSMPQGGMGPSEEETLPLLVTQDSALIASQNPAGTFPSTNNSQGNIVIYKVAKGDTPSGIALKFGISLNTLLWANNIKNSSLIKIGDELIILPISGVQYTVKKGDTIDAIAKKFKGDTSEILAFNSLSVNEALEVGSTLIIPDGEIAVPLTPAAPGRVSSPSPSRFVGLPSYAGYYLRPILAGRRTQGIHGFNGVDLADKCGTPVYASAVGTVLIARQVGYNSGYGQYVVISHGNGTQTLYGHLSQIYVSSGQAVTQGMSIGAVGSTGRSTGCHLHFEIRGAKNPF